MPSLEIGINPLRHRKNFIQRAVLGASAKLERDQLAYDSCVKSVTGEGDALRSQNAMCAFLASCGTDSQHGEVTRTTAEVSDENQFVVIESAFVEICRSYRFILERHRADSCFF